MASISGSIGLSFPNSAEDQERRCLSVAHIISILILLAKCGHMAILAAREARI